MFCRPRITLICCGVFCGFFVVFFFFSGGGQGWMDMGQESLAVPSSLSASFLKCCHQHWEQWGDFWNTSAKILLYFWSCFLTQHFSSNLQSFSIVSFPAITLIAADASQKAMMKFLACYWYYANNTFLVAHIWNCLQECHILEFWRTCV